MDFNVLSTAWGHFRTKYRQTDRQASMQAGRQGGTGTERYRDIDRRRDRSRHPGSNSSVTGFLEIPPLGADPV